MIDYLTIRACRNHKVVIFDSFLFRLSACCLKGSARKDLKLFWQLSAHRTMGGNP